MSRTEATVALGLAGAFAALSVLVADGGSTSTDEWAVHHAMFDAHLTGSRPTLADAIVPLWGEWWHGGVAVATNLVTAPAAFLVATLAVALACRRVGGRAAVALGAVYVAANALEAILKSTVTRPALYGHGMHLAAFDNSYPSGHAIRVVLLAVAVRLAWPRLRLLVATWATIAIALLELGGWHVPSDIVGGLLLVLALLATTWASCCGRESRSSSSTASRPFARAR